MCPQSRAEEEQKFRECSESGHDIIITPEAYGHDDPDGSYHCQTCGISGSAPNDIMMPVMAWQLGDKLQALKTKICH